MRPRSIWVIALAFGLIAAACGGGGGSSGGGGGGAKESSNENGGGTITIAGDKANNHGTKAVSGKSFELEADNEGNAYYFDPTVLTGSAGQKVTLEVKNEGDAEHNFTLGAQGIDQDIQSGKSVEVTVTFPQSGVLEFYCKFHRALGMVGELKAS